MTNPKYDVSINILVLGDSGVGKTSLLTRFSNDKFEISLSPTIGIDKKTKILEIGQRKVKVHAWDSAGLEKYRSIFYSHFAAKSAIILVYACDSQSSFEINAAWLRKISEYAALDVSLILVGNKCNSSNRKVSYEQGVEFASRNNMRFVETDASDGSKVNELFLSIAKVGLRKCHVPKKSASEIASTEKKPRAYAISLLTGYRPKSMMKSTHSCIHQTPPPVVREQPNFGSELNDTY